jgi:hypothetical protein
MGDVWDDLTGFFGEPAGDASAADPSDNVMSTTNGTTTTAADFTSVGGVCKAKNFPALAMVQEFQSQLNRVAQARGFSKIAADGTIGPATMALFRLVQAASSGSVMGDSTSCAALSADVDVVGAQIRTFADTLGAPPMVAAALSIKAPTIVTASGKTIVAPNAGLAGSLAMMSGIEKVAILGVAGAIGYLLLGTKKKRRT